MENKELDSVEHDDLKVIGERIRNLRRKLGYTQDELAKKAGYTSRSTINKIEKGLIDITQSKFVLLSKALGVKPSKLLGWGELWDIIPDVDIHVTSSISATEDPERARLFIKVDDQVIDVELDRLNIEAIITCLEYDLNLLKGENNE